MNKTGCRKIGELVQLTLIDKFSLQIVAITNGGNALVIHPNHNTHESFLIKRALFNKIMCGKEVMGIIKRVKFDKYNDETGLMEMEDSMFPMFQTLRW